MSNPEDVERFPEQLKGSDLLTYVEKIEKELDYEHADESELPDFVLERVHLLMELFGQGKPDSGFYIFPGGEQSEIAGEDLPAELRHLVTTLSGDETYLQGENKIWLNTGAEYMDSDTIIPKWDEMMEEGLPFVEMLERIKADPEILSGIVFPKIGVVSVVNIRFEPRYFFGWGLQFKIDPYNARVSVFGKPDQTWTAMNFITENSHRPNFVLKTAFQLALLGIRHSQEGRYWLDREFDADRMSTLRARMTGEERIPLNLEGYSGRSGNAMKNLVLEKLLDEDLIDPPGGRPKNQQE